MEEMESRLSDGNIRRERRIDHISDGLSTRGFRGGLGSLIGGLVHWANAEHIVRSQIAQQLVEDHPELQGEQRGKLPVLSRISFGFRIHVFRQLLIFRRCEGKNGRPKQAEIRRCNARLMLLC
jgi:hypothetical protein